MAGASGRSRSPQRPDAGPPASPAGVLLSGGPILSLSGSAAGATVEVSRWLHAEGGVVVAAGDGEPPAALIARSRTGDLELVDLQGRVVFPGLWDSHVHVYALGKQQQAVDLEGCTSISELQERARCHLKAHSSTVGAYLEGTHWDQELLGREPTREDLDACVDEEVPAIFYRRCWHVCVANSAALYRCGIDAHTPDVPGGIIERNVAGQPTGILREAAIEALLAPLTEQELSFDRQKEILLDGLNECVARGITAVQTNDSKEIGAISDPWSVYSALADEGNLPCRVFLTISWQSLDRSPPPPAAGVQHRSGLLSCDRVKLWTDGALGASTAALLEPYSDGPGNVGVLQMSPTEIAETVQKSKRCGYRIEAHAIGDRAASHLLSAFELHLQAGDRPVLTHCQILNNALIARMAVAGVIANVQPQFVPSDLPIARSRLGEGTERLRCSYAWRTLLRHGVPLAGGSDAPVEAPAPLEGMADAMDHVLHPTEQLSFAEALQMYTTGAAYAACVEERLGRLAPGSRADFIVLEGIPGNPAAITSAALRAAWVHGLYVDGRRVALKPSLCVPVPPPPSYEPPGGAGRAGLLRHWRRGKCPCC